jgi:hypothetical protein
MPIVPRCWKTLQRNRPRAGVGDVDFLRFVVFRPLLRVEQGGRHAFHVDRVEPLFLGGGHQGAVDAKHRKAADFHVQVGSAALHGRRKQVVDMHVSLGAYLAR